MSRRTAGVELCALGLLELEDLPVVARCEMDLRYEDDVLGLGLEGDSVGVGREGSGLQKRLLE